MSYTTVLCLKLSSDKHDAVTILKELQNSHGSAPVIWNQMCKKYFGVGDFEYSIVIERLWPLYKVKSIPEHRRAVLMMTYDLAYIAKGNYARAASDIRKWLEEFPVKDNYVNHWPEIACILESDPDCEAIGFHHTSVSENLFHGEFDEDTEEYLPIDFKNDAYELYAELNSQKEEGV